MTTKVVTGTGEQLIESLQRHTGLDGLTLIIPAEEAGEEPSAAYPEDARRRNGVPLFPTERRTQPVTAELVSPLMADN